ncbi:MAG: hypothetical protein ICV68_06470, partial [Pyrinomonadaceae bacterium]|nr:hypothetical protein [Pyrinomonadaceae bacterium]
MIMLKRGERKTKVLLVAASGLLLLGCLALVLAQRQRRVTVQERAATRAARTFTLKAGDDFQKALDAAQYGDTIILTAGASFTGPFTLPRKPDNPSTGDGYITVRTSTPATMLPTEQQRITPSHSALLPKLLSPGQGQPALRTTAGAHHFRFIGIEFSSVSADSQLYELITLGDYGTNQDTLSEVPHHLTFDRCFIHAFPAQSLKRGIELNSAHTEIINSHLSGFKVIGQEAQAILGWNGPGPFRIENNYLEAAGENVMFGGADPSIPQLVPSDISVRRNHLTKPLAWREGDAAYGGVHWTVKNLFELKNARRVVMEGNILEHSWADAQAGFAIVLSPLSQGGAAPWSVVEDVEIRNNIIRHAASAIQTKYYHTSLKRVKIINNLFEDINGDKWAWQGASAGHFLQGDGVEGLEVSHNTILHTGTL